MDINRSFVSGRKVVCPNCGAEMFLDDIDYNFHGNQDEYWICDECFSSVIIEIQYGKERKRYFVKGDMQNM